MNMTKKVVRVIHEPDKIKVLSDPVRREILHELQSKPQTQTQLAEKLVLAKPSMRHHLQKLLKVGLIKITRTQVESHGILEKYYEPTANLFIVNLEGTPPELQKYFLQSHIERLRGMLSVFQLFGKTKGQTIQITSSMLKELAEEVARHMSSVGKKYEKTGSTMNRETLLITIYSEALKEVMTEEKWKDFFANIFNSIPT
jgi:predicted transcriptional regulator